MKTNTRIQADYPISDKPLVDTIEDKYSKVQGVNGNIPVFDTRTGELIDSGKKAIDVGTGGGTMDHSILTNRYSTNQHNIGSISTLQDELNERVKDSEFIFETDGAPSNAFRPIKTNLEGQIDSSLVQVTILSMRGYFNPEPAQEYPTTFSLEWAWFIEGDEHTWLSGDLIGKTAVAGDLLIYTASGWILNKSSVTADDYFTKDETTALILTRLGVNDTAYDSNRLNGQIGAYYASQGQIIGLENDISSNTSLIQGKEDSLGNPVVDGYVLASTASGLRYWSAGGTGGGGSVDSVNGQTGVVVLETNNINETTNLYYTNARADGRIQNAIDDNTITTTSLWSSNKINAMITKVFEYKGAWDASTNTPTISDATGQSGWTWKVEVAGTQDLGSGAITFEKDNLVIHNGTNYEEHNPSIGVSSVNGQTGDVTLTTTDIAEGTNLYYSNSRADSRVQNAINDLIDSTTTLYSSTKIESDIADAVAGTVFPVTSVATKTGDVLLDKIDVGLNNVDNTSDANKAVSTATQEALNLKLDSITAGTNITIDYTNPLVPIITNTMVDYDDSEVYTYIDEQDALSYLKTEHVVESDGVAHGGAPVKLNSQGKLDVSLLDTNSFRAIDDWTPVPGNEYPDTTDQLFGDFWWVTGVTEPYIFVDVGGDLLGEEIDNGDFMVWAVGGWAKISSEMNPLLYYKLDGSTALTDDFQAGGFALKNVGASVLETDGINKKELTDTVEIGTWRQPAKEIGNTTTDTDINDIWEVGEYRSASATNLWLNLPEQSGAFTLSVESISNSTTHTRQTWSHYYNNNQWVRTVSSSGIWSSWEEVAMMPAVNSKLNISGGTMTGNLKISLATPMLTFDSTETVDTVFVFVNHQGKFQIQRRESDNTFLGTPFSIDHETSEVNFAEIPTASGAQGTDVTELTRKDYVDSRVVKLTQAEYDALTKDPTVLYAIVG